MRHLPFCAAVLLLAACSSPAATTAEPAPTVTVTATAYATVTAEPDPAPTVTATVTITATPKPASTFAPGMYVVGDEVKPGRYLATSVDGDSCYVDVKDGEEYLAQELDVRGGRVIVDVPDAPGTILTTTCEMARYKS